MIDISEYEFQFRGYPVTIASEGVVAMIRGSDRSLAVEFTKIMRDATDTAEPDEPSGWLFESASCGTEVMIERFGGVREADRHEGGQWSVYLPSER